MVNGEQKKLQTQNLSPTHNQQAFQTGGAQRPLHYSLLTIQDSPRVFSNRWSSATPPLLTTYHSRFTQSIFKPVERSDSNTTHYLPFKIHPEYFQTSGAQRRLCYSLLTIHYSPGGEFVMPHHSPQPYTPDLPKQFLMPTSPHLLHAPIEFSLVSPASSPPTPPTRSDRRGPNSLPACGPRR
jgi:hypothetical protein